MVSYTVEQVSMGASLHSCSYSVTHSSSSVVVHSSRSTAVHSSPPGPKSEVAAPPEAGP